MQANLRQCWHFRLAGGCGSGNLGSLPPAASRGGSGFDGGSHRGAHGTSEGVQVGTPGQQRSPTCDARCMRAFEATRGIARPIPGSYQKSGQRLALPKVTVSQPSVSPRPYTTGENRIDLAYTPMEPKNEYRRQQLREDGELGRRATLSGPTLNFLPPKHAGLLLRCRFP
jgi:hypothetical protein